MQESVPRKAACAGQKRAQPRGHRELCFSSVRNRGDLELAVGLCGQAPNTESQAAGHRYASTQNVVTVCMQPLLVGIEPSALFVTLSGLTT